MTVTEGGRPKVDLSQLLEKCERLGFNGEVRIIFVKGTKTLITTIEEIDVENPISVFDVARPGAPGSVGG